MRKKLFFVAILIFLTVIVFHLTPTGAIRFYVAYTVALLQPRRLKSHQGGTTSLTGRLQLTGGNSSLKVLVIVKRAKNYISFV